MYDPALGRYHVVDPLTDFMPGITPYNYCYNNPIGYTDEYGMWGDPKKKRERKLKRQNRKRARQRKRNAYKPGKGQKYNPNFHTLAPHEPRSTSGGDDDPPRNNDPMSPLEPRTALIPTDYPEPEIRFPEPPTPTYRGRPIETKISFTENIQFKFRKSEFYDLAATEKTLSDLVKTLKEYPQLQVRVIGNLQGAKEFVGKDPYSIDKTLPFNGTDVKPPVAMRTRAKAVYDFLISKGISSSRIDYWVGNFYGDKKTGQSTSFLLINP